MISGQRISDELLDRAVTGPNLGPGTLRDQLDDQVNLLVFLRFFGCIFCRETIADMREKAENDPRFPSPIFFFQGRATEGRAALRRYWPSVRAIADPELDFYDGFGIKRGSVLQMFQPAVWSGKARAKAKGHERGPRSGDIWRMPGVYLTRGYQIMWTHEYRHAADHPDYEVIAEQAAAAANA